ncbi:MAG: HEAT repeat domain-containing protein [Candidatus Hydrogenedentales bacterium]
MTISVDTPAWGMGQEGVGNGPLPAQSDYPDGLMSVINDPHRVYNSWVNGNEHFCFQGDTSVLNEAMKQFAQVDTPEHEVVLLPGPGKVNRFNGEPKKCDWMLHVVGGIVKSMTGKDGEAGVWDKYPTLTVYASGGEIDLDALQIPQGISLVTRDDLRKRYLKGMASANNETRASGAMFLAGADPFNGDNATAIKALLNDEDSYVRANAASSLARMGKVAEGAVPELKECLQKGDRYEEIYQNAIDKITQAEDRSSDAKEYEKTAKRIAEFVDKTSVRK